MKIRAIIEVAEHDTAKLYMIADYDSYQERIIWYQQMVIDCRPFADHTLDALQFHGLTIDVDGCRFFDVIGNINKTGNLIDIDFVKEEENEED